MRAVIIANGELTGPVSLAPGDLLIAADGGARHCLRLELRPSAVVGDLDSLNQADMQALQAMGVEIVRYPSRKDHTDLELAIKYAQAQGAREVLVLAALGARWDQTIANIMLPTLFPTLRIQLSSDLQEIFYLRGGEVIQIQGQPYDTVSLIPLAGDAEGITSQGLEYALDDENLSFGGTRGVSNVLLESNASISLQGGLLLVTVIHHAGGRNNANQHKTFTE